MSKLSLRKSSDVEWAVCLVLIVLAVGFFGIGGITYERPLWCALLIGAVVAMAGGTVVVVPAVALMRKLAGLPYPEGQPRTADFVGYVERLVVFGGCMAGHGWQVIAGWVALKALAQWKGWREGPDEAPGTAKARFYIFMCGTALSVIAAVIGAFFGMWLRQIPVDYLF